MIKVGPDFLSGRAPSRPDVPPLTLAPSAHCVGDVQDARAPAALCPRPTTAVPFCTSFRLIQRICFVSWKAARTLSPRLETGLTEAVQAESSARCSAHGRCSAQGARRFSALRTTVEANCLLWALAIVHPKIPLSFRHSDQMPPLLKSLPDSPGSGEMSTGES